MTAPEQLDVRSRSLKRWVLAAAASICLCALWFAYLNRGGCWLYFRGFQGLTAFTVPCLWFVLLFGLRMKGRIVLLGVTLVALLFLPPNETLHVAAAESAAASQLQQMRSAIEPNRAGQKPPSCPQTLPNIQATHALARTYRFECVACAAINASNCAYALEARPLRRRCGCTRSFTMFDDGRVFHTREDRPAAPSDEPLQ